MAELTDQNLVEAVGNAPTLATQAAAVLQTAPDLYRSTLPKIADGCWLIADGPIFLETTGLAPASCCLQGSFATVEHAPPWKVCAAEPHLRSAISHQRSANGRGTRIRTVRGAAYETGLPPGLPAEMLTGKDEGSVVGLRSGSETAFPSSFFLPPSPFPVSQGWNKDGGGPQAAGPIRFFSILVPLSPC